jgi:hypothetical protein
MLKSEHILVSSWFVSGHRGKALLRPNDELMLVVELETAACLYLQMSPADEVSAAFRVLLKLGQRRRRPEMLITDTKSLCASLSSVAASWGQNTKAVFSKLEGGHPSVNRLCKAFCEFLNDPDNGADVPLAVLNTRMESWRLAYNSRSTQQFQP